MRVRISFVLVVALALLGVFAVSAFAAVPTPPYTANTDCFQCHEKALNGPAFSRTEFTSTSVNYGNCSKCHWATVGFSYGFPHDKVLYAPTCHDCHNSQNATNIWAGQVSTPYGYFANAVSPATPAPAMHTIHTTGSWPATQFGGYCLSCHGSVGCETCHDATPAHANHVASATPDPAYAAATYNTSYGSVSSPNTRYESNYFPTKVTCVASGCHPIATLKAGTSVPTCASCHAAKTSAHGYEPVRHAATDSAIEGVACSACHDLELGPEHQKATSSSSASGCAACHPSPRDTLSPWDKSCSTAGCHTASSSAPIHAGATSSHQVVAAGAVCLGCHSGTDLGSIHKSATDTSGATSCLVCHKNGAKPATNDCTSCHFTFTEHYGAPRHTSTWTLDSCTGSGCHSTSRDLLTVHQEKDAAFTCDGCHKSTRTEVVNAIATHDTACGTCHPAVSQTAGHRATHWAQPLLQDATGPKYSYYTGSAGTSPTGDCAGCHVSNIMDEHLGLTDPATGFPVRLARKDASGAALTCASCHASLDPRVSAAIASGSTKCDACHTVHGPIETVHATSLATTQAVPCAACHKTTLTAQHATYSATTAGGVYLSGCDLCHSNTEGARGTQVQGAITSGSTLCEACHATSHPDKGGHSATSSASLVCGSCHAGSIGGAMSTQAVHANASKGACAVCHDNGARIADITTKTAECASCHTAERTDYHRTLSTVHGSTTTACSGANCHAIADVTALHSTAATTVAGVTYNGCSVCHRSAAEQPANTTCTTCHTGHGDVTALHTAPASTTCTACHETANVMTVHAASSKGQCAVCHDNAAVPTLPATAACTNCHGSLANVDPAHYPVTSHAAADSTYAGQACSACHALDMKVEHFKTTSGPVTCVQCHETKVDAFTSSWNKTCAVCHTTALHAQQATKHVSTKTTCSGSACHTVSDVSVVHAGLPGGGCNVCHTGNTALPTTTDCNSSGCHPTITGDHESAHATAGVVDAGCAGCHFTSLTTEHTKLGYTCATCHKSTNAAVQAAIAASSVDCDGCHPAVNGKDKHAAQWSSEFTAGNSSGHRVLSSLPGMRTSYSVNGSTYTWPLPSSFLKTGWTATSMVLCTDCHSFGTNPAGPHGASVTVNMDPSYAGDYSVAYLSSSSVSPSNVICAKCHTNFGAMNKVHGTGDHNGSSSGKCVLCHSQVPHGWRLPRLLAYATDPAPYKTITGGLAKVKLRTHSSTSDWSESDCNASCGGGDHSSVPSPAWPSQVNTFGTLKGTVKTTSGAAIANATVTTDKGQTATTDASGAYDLGSVATGAYTLTVAATGYTGQSKSVTVSANQAATADFALATAAGIVSGTVTDAGTSAALSGVAVSLSNGLSTTTDSLGRYSFVSVPTGTYTATYSKSGYTTQTKSVTVLAGQTVTVNVALATPAVNLAAGKTGSASSTYSSSYSAAKAFDGLLTTYWRSTSSGTQWISVDLGSSQTVAKFVIDWNGTYYAKSYRVETSTDGTNWTSRFSTSYDSTGDRTITLSTPVTARYVRLYCTSANQSSYQVLELEVWNR